MTFLALAPMSDATHIMGWGGGGVGDDDVPWTCTQGDATYSTYSK